MRAPVDAGRIRQLMESLARAADREMRIYLVGGTTAVLMGWRSSTIDVDLVTRPEDDALLRAIPAIKERLQVNIELASPLDFIPVPAGWEDRSPLIVRIGRVPRLANSTAIIELGVCHFQTARPRFPPSAPGHGDRLCSRPGRGTVRPLSHRA